MEDEMREGAQAEVVNQQEPSEYVEAAGESGDPEVTDQEQKQSHEDNRRFQAARKSGESAGYAKAMKEINEKIAKMGMSNPTSKAAIKSFEDLEAYGQEARKARFEQQAKKTGRTVEELMEEDDNREFVARKRREEKEEESKKAEENKRNEWIAADAQDFIKRHPDVDLGKLDNNKAFRKFCGSRYGRESIADLYDDYMEIAGNAEKSAVQRKENRESRSTGTGGGSGHESLTAAQQKSLDDWNRAFPGMKMTAKEFLSRG